MKKVSHGFKKLLDDFLVKFRMTLSEADPFIYISITETSTTFLESYIDDSLLALTNNSMVEKMINFWEKKFELYTEIMFC